MNTTPAQKIATVLGAGSLLVGAAIAAPAASAAPTSTAVTAAVTTTALTTSPATDLPTVEESTALVESWYQDFLGRSAADDPASQRLVARLSDDGIPALSVLADLLRSPEHVGPRIDGWYTSYLGRSTEGDFEADVWFTGVYDTSFPLEWVEQNVLASAEHEAAVTDGDPQVAPVVLVESWFRDVVGREATAADVDTWVLRFEADPAGQASRLEVLRALWYSPEAVEHRIAATYEQLLDRAPSAGELGYWYEDEVASHDDTLVAIATTDEYRAKAQHR